MKSIVILFSGDGTNMEVLIKKLHKKELLVSKVITNNPHAKGIEKAKVLGIDVEVLDHKSFNSREDYDKALVNLISPLKPDLVVLSGFMRILTPIFTNAFKAINIHPSLLPKYKGKDALLKSYESSDRFAGVTTHFVNDELDGGEIILQENFDKSGMSFDEFKTKIKEIEHEIFYKSVLNALN